MTNEKLLRAFWILLWWGVVLYLNEGALWKALITGLGLFHFYHIGYAQGRRDGRRES